jgi:hypothetical protein
MEKPQSLRQATKLWPVEIDPEFGRPYNDLGIDEAIPWLRNARQARDCEPRATPLQQPDRRAMA